MLEWPSPLSLLALALGLLLQACQPPPKVSAKSTFFDDRLYHVMVVSDLARSVESGWAKRFHAQVLREWARQRVSTALVEIDVMGGADRGATDAEHLAAYTQREELRERIQSWDPETILFLHSQDEMVPVQGGLAPVPTLVSVLFTPDDGEVVWAQQQYIRRPTAPRSTRTVGSPVAVQARSSGNPSEAARGLLLGLHCDALLPEAPASAQGPGKESGRIKVRVQELCP